MAGPWEQYAPQNDGPWTQYSGSQGFADGAIDFAKSMPRGAVSNLAGAASYAAESPVPMPDALLASQGEKMSALDKNMGLHIPEGRAGKFGEAVGSALGNPLSYVGPGTAALKIGASTLSALGGEAAGQATEGSKYEGAARLGGSLAGGILGAKMFGPSTPKAATPTYEELKGAATKGYTDARNTGLTLNPKGVSGFAGQLEQELSGGQYGFSGGQYGTSPKTFGVLHNLQQPPAGATVSASNLDAIRKNLALIARETLEGKPTADAAAATIALGKFNGYLENLPQNHILAGSASDYVRATREANANYAAAQRVRNFDTRLNKAQNSVDRQIAGSIDAQIKSKAGGMLDNPKQLRGLTQPEIDQLQLINSGSFTSNVLRQLGRGGTGVIPMGAHIGSAVLSGGATLPASAAIGVPLYAAKKTAEAMTKSRAATLAEMLAQRSPLFQQRLNALPPPDTLTNKAAVMRGLLSGAFR